jgi:hypothetical protein
MEQAPRADPVPCAAGDWGCFGKVPLRARIEGLVGFRNRSRGSVRRCGSNDFMGEPRSRAIRVQSARDNEA